MVISVVVCSTPAAAAPELSNKDRAAFRSLVEEYRGYVTPICVSDIVGAYVSFNVMRDRDFVRSLAGTELLAEYRQAIRDKRERDRSMTYHCFGPPPPPVAGQPPLSPRQRAIVVAQYQLRTAADRIPGFFDAGDAVYSRLVALRDTLLARKGL